MFIGVSQPGLLTGDMVRTMHRDAIVFACANPTPEIFPEKAKAAGAAVVSTGRSDYPNQINNVLAFPGIFRGAFDVRASDINEPMKLAAAHALAALITPEELRQLTGAVPVAGDGADRRGIDLVAGVVEDVAQAAEAAPVVQAEHLRAAPAEQAVHHHDRIVVSVGRQQLRQVRVRQFVSRGRMVGVIIDRVNTCCEAGTRP